MNRLLLDCDRMETGKNRVDVARIRVEIEDGVEIDATRDLLVMANELAEIELFVPCAHRIALRQSVCIVAAQAGFDESEQHPLAEEQEVARLEIATHALLAHDESFHQPCEPIEHVIDREKGVRYDDSFCRRV